MARPPPHRTRRLSPKGWSRLLDRDLFDRLRTDEELADLVLQAGRNTRTPYAALVTALLGQPGLAEVEARDLWARAVDRRRHLAGTLGRPVHLRVAALDLVLTEGALAPPVVLERGLVRSLVEEATTDALTGLPNRRYLLTVLEHEMRQRRKPAVAMIDIDGFKQVNDTHGHARGDEVLRGLGDILRSCRRKGDVAARVGGDEFALILVDGARAAAGAVLARAAASFKLSFGALGVDLSYGIVAEDHSDDPAEMLEKADRRMYEAKRGRSRRAIPSGPILVGLYATNRRERFFAFHALLARSGVMLLPASGAAVARRLTPLLAPRLLLADLLLPPRNGTELLMDLRAGPEARCFVVAPAQWRGVRGGALAGVGVLSFPPPTRK